MALYGIEHIIRPGPGPNAMLQNFPLKKSDIVSKPSSDVQHHR